MRCPGPLARNAILALLALPLPAAAITLDGRLDPEYGPPIVVQTIATLTGDNLRGAIDWSNGSELDALHVALEGGTLYLFLAGNQLSTTNASDPGFFADFLYLFFDTRPGGQNVLRNDNFVVDYYPGSNVLNGCAGLAFDPGFAPDYCFAGFPTGEDTWGLGPFTLHAWTAELPAAGGGPGAYLGSTAAGPTTGLTGGTNPLGIRLAIDNRNVAGVAGGCGPSPGAGVTTGIEWAIPVAALGNPTGCVRLSAFFVYKGMFGIGNQCLPPMPDGTCTWSTAATMNFGALAGDQSFPICGLTAPATRGTWGRVKLLYR